MSDSNKNEIAAANGAGQKSRKDTLWRRAWRQLRRNRLAMVCLWVLAIYAAIWIVSEINYWPPKIADWVDQTWGRSLPTGVSAWLQHTSEQKQAYAVPDDSIRNMRSTLLPGTVLAPKPATGDWASRPDWWWTLKQRFSHPLGTDFAGRDNLLRTFQGCRIAFELAILVSLIAVTLGFTLGAISGYFGGWIDEAIVYVYSVFSSVPGILLIIAIAFVTSEFLPPGIIPISLGIGLTNWVGLCRLIRGEFMKHRESTYVLAARSLGVNSASIMFRHIAPNTLHIVVIDFTIEFPGLVMTEAVLAYLGLGIQTEPSWGAVISDARQRLWLGNWWEIGGVTIVMFFFVLSLNLFGDALRDALDPKLRTAEARTA